MLVYKRSHQLVSRRYVVGSDLLDWISSAKVISANKDTIKNVVSVVGKVANAGAMTASAVKQIVDTVKAKRIPPPLKNDLSDKSAEFLKQLASSSRAGISGADINSRIAGAGFRTLRF